MPHRGSAPNDCLRIHPGARAGRLPQGSFGDRGGKVRAWSHPLPDGGHVPSPAPAWLQLPPPARRRTATLCLGPWASPGASQLPSRLVPGAAAGGTVLTRADSRTTNPSLTRRSRRGKIQRSAPPRSAGCRCALWEQGRDIPFSNDGRAVLAIACSWGRRGATTGKALSSARQASRCDAPSGPPHILPRAFPPPRPSCGPNAPPLLRAHAPIPAFP